MSNTGLFSKWASAPSYTRLYVPGETLFDREKESIAGIFRQNVSFVKCHVGTRSCQEEKCFCRILTFEVLGLFIYVLITDIQRISRPCQSGKQELAR